MKKIKKPPFISHYLVLRDLIDGIDVRSKNDSIFYFTSRIENIKLYLKEIGLEFDENAKAYSTFSDYKPYVLMQNETNIKKAYEILDRFESKEILDFIEILVHISELPDSDAGVVPDTFAMRFSRV